MPRRQTLLRGKTDLRVASPNRPAEETSTLHERRSWRRLEVAVATQPVLFRDLLSCVLDTVPGVHVVGCGEDEDQIRSILGKLRPPVLIFDYEAMGLNGEGIISRLRRAAPATRILVIARRSDDESVERVLRAGASGLVGRQQELATLVRAIHAVAAGELWANRRTAAQALDHLADFCAPVADLNGHLTKREWQIVDGVTSGLRNKEIASRFDIREKTVKNHLNSIFRTLKLDGRVGLLLWAQQQKNPKS